MTPAADHLFDVRDDHDPNLRKLSEKRAIAFHHAVTHLLFASARLRREIQTPDTFLTRCARLHHWGKLIWAL